MLGLWEDLDRLENIFLELLDDPYKKEILLYPICYCQLVRKYGEFEVNLLRLINCAEKPYKYIQSKWQDIFLELGIFYIKDKSNKIYTGKSILLIPDKDLSEYKACLISEYREDFYKFYTRLLKYWSILNSRSGFGRIVTQETSVRLLANIFNERLFKESSHYSEILSLRFSNEKEFFEGIKKLSEFYLDKKDINKLKEAQNLIKKVQDIYYGINVGKLKKDIEKLIKNFRKGELNYINIEFFRERKRRGIFKKIVDFIKKLGGRRWNSDNLETDYYFSIEHFLRRPKRQIIPN